MVVFVGGTPDGAGCCTGLGTLGAGTYGGYAVGSDDGRGGRGTLGVDATGGCDGCGIGSTRWSCVARVVSAFLTGSPAAKLTEVEDGG